MLGCAMNDPTPAVSEKLSRYLDTEGRLKGWPSRRKDQLEALRYLLARLPDGVEWSERELNELLKGLPPSGTGRCCGATSTTRGCSTVRPMAGGTGRCRPPWETGTAPDASAPVSRAGRLRELHA